MEIDVDSAQEEQQTDEDSDQEDLSVVLPVLAEHVQPSLMANTVLTTQTNVSAGRTAKRSDVSVIPTETATSQTRVPARRIHVK